MTEVGPEAARRRCPGSPALQEVGVPQDPPLQPGRVRPWQRGWCSVGGSAAAAGQRVPSSSAARGGALAGEPGDDKPARMLRRATRRSSCQSGAGTAPAGAGMETAAGAIITARFKPK